MRIAGVFLLDCYYTLSDNQMSAVTGSVNCDRNRYIFDYLASCLSVTFVCVCVFFFCVCVCVCVCVGARARAFVRGFLICASFYY